jgi:hypothetical protein
MKVEVEMTDLRDILARYYEDDIKRKILHRSVLSYMLPGSPPPPFWRRVWWHVRSFVWAVLPFTVPRRLREMDE